MNDRADNGVALAGDEISGLSGQELVPDLIATLVWFFGQMQQYDKKRGRVHLQEVWKKRLGYGFVTAQQMDKECKLHGIDLQEEDWAALDEHLARFTGNLNKRTRQHVSDSNIA